MFHALHEKCFTINVKQCVRRAPRAAGVAPLLTARAALRYTYEMCPYKSAAQKEGSSSTSLGYARR